MIDSFPHDDLIDFIDGTLDPARAEELQRALEKDPDGRRLLDDLKRQASILCELPEPRLSTERQAELDALVRAQIDAADLEPDAARPMLFDDADAWPDVQTAAVPGSYRRQHQRARQRRLLGRLASTAAAFFAVVGGGLIVYNFVILQPSNAPTNVADNTDASDETINRVAVEAQQDNIAPTIDGAVHHMPALPNTRLADAGTPASGHDAASSAAPTFVRADLALRLGSPSDVDVATLASIIDRTHDRRLAAGHQPIHTASLVQNLDYDTAVTIAASVASTDGGNIDVNAVPWRVDAETREALFGEVARRLAQGDAATEQQRLAGADQLMPTLASQLSFSSAGAELTIMIHSSDIPAFLEELERSIDARTAIDFIPVDEAERHDANWITMRRALTERLDEWAENDTIVQLPVVIRRR